MPCACKKKKFNNKGNSTSVQLKSPSTDSLVPLQELIEKVNRVNGEVDINDYDFQSTVKAQDKCFNCAMKHITFAYALLDSQDYRDIRIAAAQIYLAGLHYKAYNSSITRYCKYISLKLLRSGSFEHIKQELYKLLLYGLSLFYQTASSISYSIPYIQQTLHTKLSQTLLQICTTYSLLFTQVTYEELNRQFALGELVLASHSIAQYHQTYKLRSQLRKLWKMIQQSSNVYQDVRPNLVQAMNVASDFLQYSAQHTEEQTLAYIKQKSEDFNIK